jgi:hypothetical protein
MRGSSRSISFSVGNTEGSTASRCSFVTQVVLHSRPNVITALFSCLFIELLRVLSQAAAKTLGQRHTMLFGKTRRTTFSLSLVTLPADLFYSERNHICIRTSLSAESIFFFCLYGSFRNVWPIRFISRTLYLSNDRSLCR